MRGDFVGTNRPPKGELLTFRSVYHSPKLGIFSVHPLCSLCLCGDFPFEFFKPQRHREHGGCTENFKMNLLFDRLVLG
jgi:hypothetical protein